MRFDRPRPTQEILDALAALRHADPPTHGGRVLSYVYDPGIEGLDDLIEAASSAFLPVNGLDPTTFSSVATLERDLIDFARTITNGDSEVVGSVTSGGTESCLLASKTARDLWRAGGNEGIPTMVAPTTVHAAFHKACAYFDMEMVAIDVETATGTVDPEALTAKVDDLIDEGRPPALVVLSAPNYPIGSIDPIARIAPLMAQRGVPVHVDACVGGFILPFYPGEIDPWDFRVEGVESISLDAHKYGYAPKGVSLVMHRGRERHRSQYFACVDWPGYPVVNPTIMGSKSATALAAAWAVVHRLGIPGFTDAVSRMARATEAITAALLTIPGIEILGAPFGPLISIINAGGEDGVDPFNFIDALKEHGFLAQAQPAFKNLPRSAHITITPVTDSVTDELVAAMTSAATEVAGKPGASPDMSLLETVTADGLPDAQAQIMATLEALPKDVAIEALTGVLAAVIDPGPVEGQV